MKDFDSLQNLWKQPETASPSKSPLPEQFQASADSKKKLMHSQLRGGVIMLLTAVFIAWVGFFSGIRFQQNRTYIAVVMMILVILLQTVLIFYTWKRIKDIDDTQSPAVHLQQWQDYYIFRKKQIQWNKPLYFVFLNIALGLYFIEILGGRPAFNVTLFLVIYIAWMLFAYFVLGKITLAKEEKRLKGIIDSLQQVKDQLTN